MSNQIMIQYDTVYSKTAELRSRIEAELAELDSAYTQIQPSLQEMDSKTNAAFIETMEQNKLKAHITADTLHRLLSFIEISARQVEHDELVLKQMYAMTLTQKATQSSETELGTVESTQ
jgi:hypothetical protein